MSSVIKYENSAKDVKAYGLTLFLCKFVAHIYMLCAMLALRSKRHRNLKVTARN